MWKAILHSHVEHFKEGQDDCQMKLESLTPHNLIQLHHGVKETSTIVVRKLNRAIGGFNGRLCCKEMVMEG